jgi:polyisoprenoid-binding protein YceI
MNRIRVVLTLVVCLVMAVAAGVAASAAPSPALSLRVVPAFSSVGFSVYEFGVVKVEGNFRDFNSDIFYDPVNPERSHVNFTVQVASVETSSRARDENLRGPSFFDATRYPTMSFVSTSVTRQPDKSLLVTGDITIRGVTRRVTVTARFSGITKINATQSYAGFESTFTLDRTEFGVIGGADARVAISNNVTVHLSLGAQLQ